MTVGMNLGYRLARGDTNALRQWRMRHRIAPDPDQFTSTVNRLAARFPSKVKPH